MFSSLGRVEYLYAGYHWLHRTLRLRLAPVSKAVGCQSRLWVAMLSNAVVESEARALRKR